MYLPFPYCIRQHLATIHLCHLWYTDCMSIQSVSSNNKLLYIIRVLFRGPQSDSIEALGHKSSVYTNLLAVESDCTDRGYV